nr:hypothetical protein [Tanacetum cinerariifolium]
RLVKALAENTLRLGSRRYKLQRLKLAHLRQNLNYASQYARPEARPLVVLAVLLLKLGFALLVHVVAAANAAVYLAQLVPVGAPRGPAGQRNQVAHRKAVGANSQPGAQHYLLHFQA